MTMLCLLPYVQYLYYIGTDQIILILILWHQFWHVSKKRLVFQLGKHYFVITPSYILNECWICLMEKHFIVHPNQQNNERSMHWLQKMRGSRTYHLLDWLVIALVTNKETWKWQVTMVCLPHSLLQKNAKFLPFLRCLPLPFVQPFGQCSCVFT